MDSNTYSTGSPDGLTALAALVDQLAAQDRAGLTDAVRAERVLILRRLLDRLEGHWLQELAGVDARGAAGADQGVPAGSTASWLRNRLHLGAAAAHSAVRTARALFGGPLTQTARALTDGELSPAHAAVLAHGTHDLPAQVTAEAEPVLLEVAGRLDPPAAAGGCAPAAGRRPRGHHQPDRTPPPAARAVADPTFEGMVAVNGLLEAEAGQTLLAALEPLARPATANDTRTGGQRRADALTELAHRQLEGGRLPQTSGVRPQLTVLVDLDSLQGRPGTGGGVTDTGPLDPEACRRLAGDGAVTRVLVTRQPTGDHDHQHPTGGHGEPGDHDLAAWLRTAAALLPPVLGGAPTQPLEVGRTTRVVQPAQRVALAVRDGGCVFPAASVPWPGVRPIIWCIGWMAAPPTWPTWPCCAGPIIGRCMRAAGS